jgi:thiosulfate/3-mercaptopyruvate sulfurtransferase
MQASDLTNPKFAGYAHPERLVSSAWLSERLDDPTVVVVESDEDVLLYETGHIRGAVKVDWHLDLNKPDERDYIDGAGFAALMNSRGISRDSTVVIYGDKSNWWAAYALWVFNLFGHPDVRLLDGGRDKWIDEGREVEVDASVRTTSQSYPVVVRDDITNRAFRDDVLKHAGPLIDIRSPQEFSGQVLSAPGYPEEGVLRGGHIPRARNVPWARAAAPDGTVKSVDELRAVYLEEIGLDANDEIVTYCRIGERSSHSWFVLTYLLGFPNVRNYDGSWTEWGNSVRVPIEKGPAQ